MPVTSPAPSSVVFEETMCCGYKRCPTVRVYADGSVEIFETHPPGTVRFNPEQAARLTAALAQYLHRLEIEGDS